MLIDTCIVYRWLIGTFDKPELFPNGATVSVISIWEMHIKNNAGKLPLPNGDLLAKIEGYGFNLLNITASHAQTIATLPNHHKDPFDRMLIAQALFENLTIATYDKQFLAYLPGTLLV